MSPAPERAASRVRMNLALYVVALVTAAACVVVTVSLVRELQDDAPATLPRSESLQVEELDEAPAEEQERFGDVLEAASTQTAAFINIRYDDAEAAIAKVKAGATGAFLEQYEKSTGGLLDLLTRNKAVRTGEVVWAGVVAADEDSATVIVATTGTVANTQTDNKPVAETYRLRLDLVKQDDAWLTNNIEFVA